MSNHAEEEKSNIDRLSSLHDSILLHVLSFLPTKDSIKTSVLSKRFRHAWASVPALDFTINNINDRDAVDRVLALHTSPSIAIFRITSDNALISFHDGNACSWIDHAASRGTRDLRINVRWGEASILDRIFHCQRLEALELKGYIVQPIQSPSPITPFFTNLTTLRLNLSDISANKSDLIGDFISSCCNLQLLWLHAKHFGFLRISAPRLRRLELLVGWSLSEVVVSCPGLEEFYLTIGHSIGKLHTIGKFQGDMPSLCRASFKTEFHGYRFGDCSDWTPMFRSVAGAKFLELYCLDYKNCRHILEVFHHQSRPTFQNLKTLKLWSCFHYHNVELMVYLLENSPRLTSLTVSLVPTCGCEDKRKKWTSRKLPAKFLYNLMSVSILKGGGRQRVINKGEFLMFLSTNVSEWNKVIKRI